MSDLNIQTLAGWSGPGQMTRYGAAMRTQRAVAAGKERPVLGLIQGERRGQ
jgi:hypothetical protein